MTHDSKPSDPPSLIEVAAELARDGKGLAAQAVRNANERIKELEQQLAQRSGVDVEAFRERFAAHLKECGAANNVKFFVDAAVKALRSATDGRV